MNFSSFLLEKNNLLCFTAIAIATVIIEVCIKKNVLTFFVGRKILHITAITICAYCIYNTSSKYYLSFVFLIFAIGLAILVYKKIFASSANASYGIALFPLSFFILLQMPFLHIHTIMFAVLTLAFADAAAGYVGYTYGKRKIVFLQEEKSWEGFAAFYIVTLLLYLRYFGFTFPYLGLVVALLPALVELFSVKGSDNLTVPIVTALWFYVLQSTSNDVILQNTLYVAIMLLLAILTVYKNWLSVSGAAAAFLVGIVVVFFKNVLHLIPLALFLISGSLANRLNEAKKSTSARNAIQVFANGIVAIVCLVIYYFTQKEIYYIAFFASIAISMADTISSEVGKYFKLPTYDILLGKKTVIGLSGGVSVAGTFAGLLASVVYSVVLIFIFKISMPTAITIASIGFIGMLIDSVLGSALQAKYSNADGTIVEQKTTQLIKGFAWCTNDVVNFLSNVVTLCILFTAYYLL